MKAIYLTLSIIFTVLILILSFGNIAAQCSQLVFFFFPVHTTPTVLFLGIAVLGMVTGAFYHAFLGRVLGSGNDESDEF